MAAVGLHGSLWFLPNIQLISAVQLTVVLVDGSDLHVRVHLSINRAAR